MATASDYLKQIEAMGPTPSSLDLKNQVTDAYKSPILTPLVEETANLNAQFLPSLFEPFTRMGTSASDMSPAAKLAMIGASLGRLNSRIDANNKIGNYYGAQIGDIAGNIGETWKNQNSSLWNLYNAASQKEQFEKQMEMQRAQLNATLNTPKFPDQPQPAPAPDQNAQRESTANAIIQRIKQIAQVSYLQNGQIKSKAMNSANQPLLEYLYNQLSALGYDPYKIKALGNG
jgi:hypothetical protein